MKKILKFTAIALALATSFTSCKDDYLDINQNPNNATYSNPELVLPGALNSTASMLSTTYNDYGAFVGGFQANGYGYSYVGSDVVTYNYTASSNNGLWTSAFANLKNYQYIINQSPADGPYVLYNAVARIMKAHNYQLLVDEYGDVPYSDALKGVEVLTPKYDKAEDVYKACVSELDAAIVLLKANINSTVVTKLANHDILFGNSLYTAAADITPAAQITRWIQFANNIKLRILMRCMGGAVSTTPLSAYATTAMGTFSSEGFLKSDALVQPGYSASSANINPQWTSVIMSYSGTYSATGKSRVPTKYVIGFYDGSKLTDPRRGALVYRSLSAPLNQLGIDPLTAAASAPTANFPAWYTGSGTGVAASDAQGVFKGKLAPAPVMLAAEVNFLLAEASARGFTAVAGNDATNFDAGLVSSFTYLEKFGSTNAVVAGNNPGTDVTAYKTANSTSPLVNYPTAGTFAARLEAIITQKYIALNYIHSHEAWNEFRRTGFPVSNPAGTATTNLSSVTSVSSRADKLPVRLLYPQSEINLNSNVPQGLSPFANKIFWDTND